MRWSEQARHEEQLLKGSQHPFGLQANRYLILIAYCFGLAIGVHLLNLLAVFFIALIFFFTEFDRDAWTVPGKPEWMSFKRWQGIVLTGIVSAAAFLLVYPLIIQKLPELAGQTGWPMLLLFGVLGLVIIGVYYSQRHRMQVVNLVALSVLMVLIGYSTYALIFIRSASNPPIDENDPETAEAIVAYLTREQYGETPLFQGPAFNDRTNRVEKPRKELPAPLLAATRPLARLRPLRLGLGLLLELSGPAHVCALLPMEFFGQRKRHTGLPRHHGPPIYRRRLRTFPPDPKRASQPQRLLCVAAPTGSAGHALPFFPRLAAGVLVCSSCF